MRPGQQSLGTSQLREHVEPGLRRWRLDEGTAEVQGGRVRITARKRVTSGGPQHVHDPSLCVRLGGDQMSRHSVHATVIAGQQPGGLRMQRGDTRWRQFGEQGLADDRVHERQLTSCGEQIAGPQRVGRLSGPVTLQARERRRMAQRAPRAEHSRGHGKSLTIHTQSREPNEHAATDRSRAQLANPARELSRRTARFRPQGG
jgi:hypothetical protein